MQKMTRVIALILVLAAALLAILAFGVGKRSAAPPTLTPLTDRSIAPDNPVATKLTSVVIAAKALPAGAPLDGSELKVVQLPERPEMGYSSIESLLGAVPKIDLPAGSPILADDLARGLAVLLRPGERALAVPVDEVSGVGNRIAPGDYVDVFVSLKSTLRDTGRANVDDVQSRLLLSRLRVLAYGNHELGATRLDDEASKETRVAPKRPGSDDSSSREKRTSDSANNEPARMAVLAVPVELTNRLLLGAQQGKLALALRHPGDNGTPDSGLFPAPATVLAARGNLDADARRQLGLPENQAFAGIDLPGLAGPKSAPRSTPAQRSVAAPIEIIRGASRESRPASP